MTVVLMGSCLKSDSSETTLYNDAVITGFTLGTMTKYTNGTKGTYSGSSIFFNIDQADNGLHTFKDTTIIGRCIYNKDSLLLGTDLKHVVSTITTRSNGFVVIERLDEPGIFDYYSRLDSIDFTKPRRVLVGSSDGSTFNQYYISIDAHQEDGNKFVWKLIKDDWAPALDAQQLPDGIKQILGSSTTEQYAMSTDNKLMVSHDKGVTWQEEVITADADMLPVNKSGENHVWCYTMTVAEGAVEQVKFKIAGSWDVNWGYGSADGEVNSCGKGTSGGKNIGVPEGTWIIMFNDITGEFSIVAKNS